MFRDPAKIVSSAMKARYQWDIAFDIWIELLLNQLAVPGYLEEAEAQDTALHTQYMVCATKVEEDLLFLRYCLIRAASSVHAVRSQRKQLQNSPVLEFSGKPGSKSPSISAYTAAHEGTP